jgi:hypothetical protein
MFVAMVALSRVSHMTLVDEGWINLPSTGNTGHGRQDEPGSFGAENTIFLLPDVTGTSSLLAHSDDNTNRRDQDDDCT